ncbi:hypothetical protein AB0F24_02605 [Streptomyces platensis]|uniref:hypothetical protein n=1 Tax=Streptomyces platensis TaxID=58346 RepID=UPI0033DF7A09
MRYGKGRPRDRLLGAGLQGWPSAVTGIDVEPAPEGQEDEDDLVPPPGPLSGQRDMTDVAKAVLDALTQYNKPVARKPLKDFTVAVLHAMSQAAWATRRPPITAITRIPRMEVIGIVGIHHKRTSWPRSTRSHRPQARRSARHQVAGPHRLQRRR